MSNLTINKLSALNATTNRIEVANGDYIHNPGSILQVVQKAITTPTAVSIPASYNAYTSIPDLFLNITPKKNDSKIYVSVRWFGEFSNQTLVWSSMMGVKRNGVSVGHNPNSAGASIGIAMPSLSYYGNDANSTPEQCYFDYLDSPASGSSVEYQVYLNCTGALTLYTNRTLTAGASDYEYGTSTITLWEIAQ